MTLKTVRVLVVDDSAMNRRVLTGVLSAIPGVQVVGTAADGDEALRAVTAHTPDVITLDLEMPRMDGFTFLRLLMATRPTPVVVVSSNDGRESVFRALELGALDFIAKPKPALSGGTEVIRAQLEAMVAVVRQLTPAAVLGKARTPALRAAAAAPEPTARETPEPTRVLAIAASTGGPTALMELFGRLPAQSPAAIVVAQHMPERFTRSFADRLDRASAFRVREAEHLHELAAGNAFVCPGGRCMEVDRREGALSTRVVFPAPQDRHAPSADRMFSSVAAAVGERAIAVVLTGMGDDAARGVVDIKRAGGLVLVESEESAVVYGMPKAALDTGCVDEQLSLSPLVQRICDLLA